LETISVIAPKDQMTNKGRTAVIKAIGEYHTQLEEIIEGLFFLVCCPVSSVPEDKCNNYIGPHGFLALA
jgi:hypothetical protein